MKKSLLLILMLSGCSRFESPFEFVCDDEDSPPDVFCDLNCTPFEPLISKESSCPYYCSPRTEEGWKEAYEWCKNYYGEDWEPEKVGE